MLHRVTPEDANGKAGAQEADGEEEGRHYRDAVPQALATWAVSSSVMLSATNDDLCTTHVRGLSCFDLASQLRLSL